MYKKFQKKDVLVLDALVAHIAKYEETSKDTFIPVFKTNDFCLYNADCLAVMARFPENYIDMIFADPPYMLSNNGFTCHAGRMVSVNKRVLKYWCNILFKIKFY